MLTAFSKCPSCGQRFGVRLTRRTKAEENDEIQRSQAATATDQGTFGRGGAGHGITGDVKEGEFAVVAEQEIYEDSYRCSKCGHEWTERQTKRRRDAAPAGAELGD